MTYPDGTPLSPNQSFNKTWRLKNTGTCTWSGYTLAFVSGDRLSGPDSVSVPTTAPGQTVDVGVPLMAPGSGGNYKGYWQLKDNQGVNVGGGGYVWVQISVPYSSPPPPAQGTGTDTTISCTSGCPSVVTPGQQFRPQITVKLGSGQLLQSRGDMLRSKDSNTLFGAWPQVAVVGTVNAGDSYTFTFYADHPIVAPSGEGNYQSIWQLWQNSAWVGPAYTIAFTVKNGGGTRPNPPTLTGPSDWIVFGDGHTPALCAQSDASNIQYKFQIYNSGQTPESDWQDGNCWTPPTLAPYTFRWHAKVRDKASGLESDWSADHNFTVASQQLTLAPISFYPASPTGYDGDLKVYSCVHGFGDVNIGLWYEINAATDGSANGEWHGFGGGPGGICPNSNDPSTWGSFPSREYADGDHLVRVHGKGPHGETTFVEAVYHLNHRRPQDAIPISPIGDTRLNSRTVQFVWHPSVNAQSYRLVVSPNPDLSAPVFDANVGNVSSYQYTFGQDYSPLYWQVTAINDLGQASGGVGSFGIDRVAPVAAMSALSSTVSDSTFPVSWGGTDSDAGVRWYNVQYRDGNRPDSTWVDWQTNTTTIVASFIGQPGHTYYFRAQAMDNAANTSAYADGDGDTHTTIDLNSRAQTPWWDSGYAGKRNLVIVNNDPHTLPSGYPIHLHFDAGTSPSAGDIYNASRAATKGDDVRVVYQDKTELSRYVQTFTPDQINLWFDLQSSIGGSPSSDSTDYQLYYGNANASHAPGNINDVLPEGADANTMGLWHTMESSGNSLLDSSGRGYSGTISNGSRSTDGKFGNTVVFNGSNTTLDMGDHSDYDVRAFTLEGWFNFAAPGTQVLMRRDMGNHGDDAYHFGTRDGKIEYQIAGRTPLRSQTVFQANRWYHLAVTYDGTTQRLFVNGHEEANQTDTQGVPPSSGSLILGNNRAGSDWFAGKMQDIRISNVVRTSFPYASFADISSEPSTAAGSPVAPPQSGAPSLAIQSVNLYLQADGTNTLAVVVQNQGNASTGNGFATDLYLNHQPTGPGDTTGSVNSWVADPIDANGAITLTAALTPTNPVVSTAGRANASGADLGVPTETTQTFYVQTDSTGALAAYDKVAQTVSDPITICTASADAFEGNVSPATAASITTDGTPQVHNVDKAGKEAWASFNATAGVSYTIGASNLGPNADTVLSLYAPDGTTLLASNDDYNDSLASQIGWQASSSGTYYIKVTHWSPNVGGCGTTYDLSVSSNTQALPTSAPTSAPTNTPTATSAPASTSTARPASPTSTPFVPTSTATSAPTGSSTATPMNTALPAATVTSLPVASATPSAPSTATWTPTATSTPMPTSTPPLPPPTMTPVPPSSPMPSTPTNTTAPSANPPAATAPPALANTVAPPAPVNTAAQGVSVAATATPVRPASTPTMLTTHVAPPPPVQPSDTPAPQIQTTGGQGSLPTPKSTHTSGPTIDKVSVPSRSVTDGSAVTVSGRVRPNATVDIAADVSTTTFVNQKAVIYVRPSAAKKGAHPHMPPNVQKQPACRKGMKGCVARTVTRRVAHTTRLYHAAMRVRADRKGHFRATVRLHYRAKKAMRVTLMVMVRTPQGQTSRWMGIKVMPPAARKGAGKGGASGKR